MTCLGRERTGNLTVMQRHGRASAANALLVIKKTTKTSAPPAPYTCLEW
jgi:hypothetical protein